MLLQREQLKFVTTYHLQKPEVETGVINRVISTFPPLHILFLFSGWLWHGTYLMSSGETSFMQPRPYTMKSALIFRVIVTWYLPHILWWDQFHVTLTKYYEVCPHFLGDLSCCYMYTDVSAWLNHKLGL